MKSVLVIAALVFGQAYQDYDSMDSLAYEEDPAFWDGAQDDFEGYEESTLVEQHYEGDYQPGMYFAGNGIGSTPAERMVMAAANGPNKFNCKACKNDIGCLTFCSTYVVRGKIVSLKKKRAQVDVLCNYKGTPALAKGVPKSLKAKAKKARKAKKSKKVAKKAVKAKKAKKVVEEDLDDIDDLDLEDLDLDFQGQDYQDYQDYEYDDSRLFKRSNNPKTPKTPKSATSKGIRVRIPKSCAKRIKVNTSYTLFLVKAKKGQGYRLFGSRSACNVRDDTIAVQTDVLKGGRQDFQGPQCSIGAGVGVGNRSLKAKSPSTKTTIGSSILVGAALALF